MVGLYGAGEVLVRFSGTLSGSGSFALNGNGDPLAARIQLKLLPIGSLFLLSSPFRMKINILPFLKEIGSLGYQK